MTFRGEILSKINEIGTGFVARLKSKQYLSLNTLQQIKYYIL